MKILYIALIAISACSIIDENSKWLPKKGSLREIYYINSKGSQMPVWILGQDSDQVFLFVHGGPGLSGIVAESNLFIQLLAKKFRVVLYDERASGFSRGHPKKSSITLNQHVEDLDHVIKSIMLRYPESQIHLFGDSFGGLIASAYTSIHQENVKTLLLFSPLLSITRLTHHVSHIMLKEFINPYLARLDISTKSRQEWEDIQNFYINNPILTLEGLLAHRIFAAKASKIMKFDDCITYYKEDIPTILKDPMFEISVLIKQVNYSIRNLSANGEEERDLETDSTFPLSKITVPVLLITGDKDFIIPNKISQESFQKISSSQKEEHVLNNSPHIGFLVHPELSAKYVTDFIQKYSAKN
ncbi:MAG: alpha/beta fold hydrolase [Brevinema sp.]